MKYFKVKSCAKTIITMLFLCYYTQGFAQRKNLIFESAFDSQNSVTQWYERNLTKPWSGILSRDRVRANGGTSLKVELRRNGDNLSLGPRAELGMSPKTSQNEGWYGFSNYFPAEYTSDVAPECIAQWQAYPDLSLRETWRSPALGFEIEEDHYRLAVRWSSAKINTNTSAGIEYIDLGPVDHNRWNDWVFHIKWGYNSGTLEVWKNGSVVVKRLNKPLGYNDDLYPYFKVGIYKWEWNNARTKSTTSNRTYYIDEVRVGSYLATYADVAPGVVSQPTTEAPKPAEPTEATKRMLPIAANTLTVIKNKDNTYTASFTASKTVLPPTQFILNISSNNGRSYYSVYSTWDKILEVNKKYTLNFK